VKEKDEIGKKPVAKRKTAGWTAKTHPKPHDSPLWAHLELIRKMRLGRRPWREIAEAIEKAGGPKVAFNTVHNFYKRVANRAKSGKGLPLGFEDPFSGAPLAPPAAPAPLAASAAPPPPVSHPSPLPGEDVFIEPEDTPPVDLTPNKTRKLRELKAQREREQREQKP
jgi:hypothetical protein